MHNMKKSLTRETIIMKQPNKHKEYENKVGALIEALLAKTLKQELQWKKVYKHGSGLEVTINNVNILITSNWTYEFNGSCAPFRLIIYKGEEILAIHGESKYAKNLNLLHKAASERTHSVSKVIDGLLKALNKTDTKGDSQKDLSQKNASVITNGQGTAVMKTNAPKTTKTVDKKIFPIYDVNDTSSVHCQKCGSSMYRRNGVRSKKCIQPKCSNYYKKLE